ncbi:hypothetical protein KBY23_04500, partial [Ruegeria pomeroyi]|nr:hypothetical protein [Ruegeria pomeroyi]MCG6559232.1 hypothetical protein [Ruegeria alba]
LARSIMLLLRGKSTYPGCSVFRNRLCASCCGKAARILDMATDWAANRRQFCQPLRAFQVTGSRLTGIFLTEA